MKVIQTTASHNSAVPLLSLLVYLSTCTVLVFPPNKCLFHYFLSLWQFFFCKTKRPTPCHWPLVYRLGFRALTAVTWPQSGQGTLALLQTTAGWSYPRSGPREGPKHKLSIHMGKHRIQGRFEGVTTGFCEPSVWALPLAGWFPDSATLLGSDFWESIWLAIRHWVACGLVHSGLVICCRVGW